MNAAVPQQIDQPSAPSNVGAKLRAAREAAGLSVADVSRQLNLGTATIIALENNDMEALPPLAFVRGYVRSYAKVMDLDAEGLLEELQTTSAADPEIAPVTGLSSQRASSDPLMRWMSVAVSFVLAVMVVIWWQTKNGDERVASAPQTETPQPPAQSEEMLALQRASGTPPGNAAPAQPAPAPEAVPAAQPATPEPVAGEPEPVVDPAAGEAETTVATDLSQPGAGTAESAAAGPATDDTGAVEPAEVEGSVAEAPAMDTVEPEPQPGDVTETVQPTVAMAQPAAPSDETLTAAADQDEAAAPVQVAAPDTSTHAEASAMPGVALGDDELVLMFDGSSWTEVSDALGRRLYYGLYDSPAPLRVTGQLPFLVFLGNSPAVTLLFQGETHDQTAFNRANNTARFAVDGSGLRRP